MIDPDNVEKLQDMMKNTKENMEAAEEMMAYVDENERKALKQKMHVGKKV